MNDSEGNGPTDSPGTPFDYLDPYHVIAAVEQTIGARLDGSVFPFVSYVNRVYGLKTEDGDGVVVKFYRPDRWSEEAILEEHGFVRELADAEIPVVAPLSDEDGETLFELEVEIESSGGAGRSADALLFRFAVYPQKGGRTFDAESDEDWFRLGSVVGRVHAVGAREPARHRPVLAPQEVTAEHVQTLLSGGSVHPDVAGELEDVTRSTLERIRPRFDQTPMQRLHGDCHRGNILDRPGEGLLLIDFDDMVMGPAVQDLWLLFPDYGDKVGREITMLLDGYHQFAELDRREFDLVEPLRFMRMIHYLAWQERQRYDRWFQEWYPEWGNKAFWIKEVEDLREQSLRI